MSKSKRIIWSNNDYDEWCDAMKGEITDEEITPEYYGFCRETDLDDERANLNVEVNGYIIAFADLGLWNGRVTGSKIIGTNVKDILHYNCDYCTWYCDPYNVRLDAVHHDGTNHILYRVVESKKKAIKVWEDAMFGRMNEKQFRRATKSLRPYIKSVYGF